MRRMQQEQGPGAPGSGHAAPGLRLSFQQQMAQARAGGVRVLTDHHGKVWRSDEGGWGAGAEGTGKEGKDGEGKEGYDGDGRPVRRSPLELQLPEGNALEGGKLNLHAVLAHGDRVPRLILNLLLPDTLDSDPLPLVESVRVASKGGWMFTESIQTVNLEGCKGLTGKAEMLRG